MENGAASRAAGAQLRARCARARAEGAKRAGWRLSGLVYRAASP